MCRRQQSLDGVCRLTSPKVEALSKSQQKQTAIHVIKVEASLLRTLGGGQSFQRALPQAFTVPSVVVRGTTVAQHTQIQVVQDYLNKCG